MRITVPTKAFEAQTRVKGNQRIKWERRCGDGVGVTRCVKRSKGEKGDWSQVRYGGHWAHRGGARAA